MNHLKNYHIIFSPEKKIKHRYNGFRRGAQMNSGKKCVIWNILYSRKLLNWKCIANSLSVGINIDFSAYQANKMYPFCLYSLFTFSSIYAMLWQHFHLHETVCMMLPLMLHKHTAVFTTMICKLFAVYSLSKTNLLSKYTYIIIVAVAI